MNRQMTRLAAIVVGVASLGSLFAPSPVKAENCVNAAAKGGGRGSVIGGVAGGVAGAGAGAAVGTGVGGPAGTVGGAVGGAEVGAKTGAAAGGTAGTVGAGGDCVIEEATGVSPYKEGSEAVNGAVNEAEEELRKLPF